MILPNNTPHAVPTEKCNDTENDNLTEFNINDFVSLSCSTNRNAEEYSDNIHQSILSCINKSAANTAFLKQIAQHQHTNQRGTEGTRSATINVTAIGKIIFFLFLKPDEAEAFLLHVLFACQKFHYRRLDNRNKSHICISSQSNRTSTYFISAAA